MKIIHSDHYKETMETLVLPYLAKRKQTGFFFRIKDQNLYYQHFTADQERAVLVMLHGFTEGVDKFAESVYYLLQDGISVWQLQQREHGESYRSTRDPALIYIENYNDLIEDVHAFFHTVVFPAEKSKGFPFFLYGHSMGGGVSSCYLERYPDDFARAVLSSPMLEMKSGKVPVPVTTAFVKFLLLLGKGKDYLPGSVPFNGIADFADSCSNCEPRYLYWFQETAANVKNQMCVPALRTTLEFLRITQEATKPENCRKVRAKVLMMQAGRDLLVGAGGQEAFISRISDGRIVRLPEAKHEIYMGKDEDLEKYWTEILAFFR